MEQETSQPIRENLWWVIPGKLAGVRKPTQEELSQLQTAGIRAIVSVMDDPSNLDLYQQADIPHLWVPIKGGTAPSQADIKTAGTASLLVSLPTVLVGVVKYASRGAFTDRAALSNTVAPMGIGSVIGAVVGGMLVGIVPAAVLKVTLGIILNVSAFRVFHKAKSHDS